MIDRHVLRRPLLDYGYFHLPVSGNHALAVGSLPRLNNDPFDRLLVVQATMEGLMLLTADPEIAAHPGPILRL